MYLVTELYKRFLKTRQLWHHADSSVPEKKKKIQCLYKSDEYFIPKTTFYIRKLFSWVLKLAIVTLLPVHIKIKGTNTGQSGIKM